jgi:hypothetical protein
MTAISRGITVSGITNFPVQEVGHEDHMQAFFYRRERGFKWNIVVFRFCVKVALEVMAE